MSEIKELAGLTPDTDPINSAPKTEHGYPVRLHARGGQIRYTKNQADREFIIDIDNKSLELHELINAPWWKRLLRRMKPEF